MRAFCIVSEGHPLICGRIATMMNTMFREMNINATADWYYDDSMDVDTDTEYGVRIDMSGVSREEWERLKRSIEQHCRVGFGYRVRWEEKV